MSGFTEADVQLVTDAMREAPAVDLSDYARAVLTALADAGRLTPADAVQPRVKILHIWYRSLQADGSVWCESSSGREVVALSEGIAVRFERLLVTEVTGAWEPWVAADGTP